MQNTWRPLQCLPNSVLHTTSMIYSHSFWTSVKSPWWCEENIKRAITIHLHTNQGIKTETELIFLIICMRLKHLQMGIINTVMLAERMIIISFIQLVRMWSEKLLKKMTFLLRWHLWFLYTLCSQCLVYWLENNRDSSKCFWNRSEELRLPHVSLGQRKQELWGT